MKKINNKVKCRCFIFETRNYGVKTFHPLQKFLVNNKWTFIDFVVIGLTLVCHRTNIDLVCMGLTLVCHGTNIDFVCIGLTLVYHGTNIDLVCMGLTLV